ncbi:hypothetical protein BJ508DRAFT_307921, partial [Ascobolus immersus RN42]
NTGLAPLDTSVGGTGYANRRTRARLSDAPPATPSAKRARGLLAATGVSLALRPRRFGGVLRPSREFPVKIASSSQPLTNSPEGDTEDPCPPYSVRDGNRTISSFPNQVQHRTLGYKLIDPPAGFTTRAFVRVDGGSDIANCKLGLIHDYTVPERVDGNEEGPKQFSHDQFFYDREWDYGRGISKDQHSQRAPGKTGWRNAIPEATSGRIRLGLIDYNFLPYDHPYHQAEIDRAIKAGRAILDATTTSTISALPLNHAATASTGNTPTAPAGTPIGSPTTTALALIPSSGTLDNSATGNTGKKDERPVYTVGYSHQGVRVLVPPPTLVGTLYSRTGPKTLNPTTTYNLLLEELRQWLTEYGFGQPIQEGTRNNEFDEERFHEMLCKFLEKTKRIPYFVREELLFGVHGDVTTTEINEEITRELNRCLGITDPEKMEIVYKKAWGVLPYAEQSWNQRRRFLWAGLYSVARSAIKGLRERLQEANDIFKHFATYCDYYALEEKAIEMTERPQHPHRIDPRLAAVKEGTTGKRSALGPLPSPAPKRQKRAATQTSTTVATTTTPSTTVATTTTTTTQASTTKKAPKKATKAPAKKKKLALQESEFNMPSSQSQKTIMLPEEAEAIFLSSQKAAMDAMEEAFIASAEQQKSTNRRPTDSQFDSQEHAAFFEDIAFGGTRNPIPTPPVSDARDAILAIRNEPQKHLATPPTPRPAKRGLRIPPTDSEDDSEELSPLPQLIKKPPCPGAILPANFESLAPETLYPTRDTLRRVSPPLCTPSPNPSEASTTILQFSTPEQLYPQPIELDKENISPALREITLPSLPSTQTPSPQPLTPVAGQNVVDACVSTVSSPRIDVPSPVVDRDWIRIENGLRQLENEMHGPIRRPVTLPPAYNVWEPSADDDIKPSQANIIDLLPDHEEPLGDQEGYHELNLSQFNYHSIKDYPYGWSYHRIGLRRYRTLTTSTYPPIRSVKVIRQRLGLWNKAIFESFRRDVQAAYRARRIGVPFQQRMKRARNDLWTDTIEEITESLFLPPLVRTCIRDTPSRYLWNRRRRAVIHAIESLTEIEAKKIEREFKRSYAQLREFNLHYPALQGRPDLHLSSQIPTEHPAFQDGYGDPA